jgi:hypothetical protein
MPSTLALISASAVAHHPKATLTYASSPSSRPPVYGTHTDGISLRRLLLHIGRVSMSMAVSAAGPVCRPMIWWSQRRPVMRVQHGAPSSSGRSGEGSIGEVAMEGCMGSPEHSRSERDRCGPQDQQGPIADEVLPSAGDARTLDQLVEGILISTLQGLPPRHRAILLLADFSGFAVPEIARMLEISEAAACSALAEARDLLGRG